MYVKTKIMGLCVMYVLTAMHFTGFPGAAVAQQLVAPNTSR